MKSILFILSIIVFSLNSSAQVLIERNLTPTYPAKVKLLAQDVTNIKWYTSDGYLYDFWGFPSTYIYDEGLFYVEYYDLTLNKHRDTFNIVNSSCDDNEVSIQSNTSFINCNTTLNVNEQNLSLPFSYTAWLNDTLLYQGTNPTINNVCAGEIRIESIDSEGCINYDTINIAANDCEIQVNFHQTPNSFSNSCDGILSADVSALNSPFTSIWSTGEINQDTIFNVCPGFYSLIVTDSQGCSDTVSTELINVCDHIDLLSYLTIIDASNATVCDGGISFDPSINFTSINWSNGMSGSLIDSLCVGNYTFYTVDNIGCIDSGIVEISDYSQILDDFDVYHWNTTFLNNNDGAIFVDFYNTSCNCQFSLNGLNVFNNVFTDLGVGLYEFCALDLVTQQTACKTVMISSLSNSLFFNNYQDSISVDTLYSNAITNCSIDFSSIDTAYISNYQYISSDSISITWMIESSGDLDTVISTYYVDNLIGGVNLIVLQLQCPIKSSNEYIEIFSNLYINELSSITKENMIDFKIYPNPFNNSLSITNSKIKSIRLVDTYGREILRKENDFNEIIFLADLNFLNNGFYYILIERDNQIFSFPVIKIN